jgi:anti-sigma factor RsiW
MTCSFDLKEYVLGESPREEARRIEAHAAACEVCRDEIARLQLTRGALLGLRDEEPPRRIAFVSDRVFEPRWYRRLWNSGPHLGFAAAAMLACAILVHAFALRAAPAQPPPPVVATAPVDTKARQREQTAELLQAAEHRYEIDRRATIAAFSEQNRLLQKQVASMYVTANNLRAGE